MSNGLHEECGVFGIYNSNDLSLAQEVYLALYALQHRGQMSCGIAVNNGGVIDHYKDCGIVPEVFDKQTLANLSENGKGDIAVGHVRYSPNKLIHQVNSQPLVMRYARGTIALANNGCLVNTAEIRRELEHDGCVFQTSGDAELIAYLIARSRLAAGSIEKAVSVMMNKVRGAYSIVLMSPRKLLAVRDPNGFRPLCIGKLEDSYIFTSESCALDTLGAKFVRDVEPGEIVWTEGGELHSIRDHCGGPTSLCVFEHVYFARPDSVIDGASVHESRLRAGAFLARQSPVEADVVVGVPDSGLDAAIGYSRESGITYSMGFIKNRYIGRTFIQDTQAQRVKSVQIKLNPLRSAVSGKRVVLVDDSIVRGTTIARIVGLLRNAGAVEVHVRISSPPFLNPCYFGTDIDSKDKLIACRMTRDEICKTLGADSLDYLSLENLGQIAPDSTCDMCMGCFTGNYPIPVPEEPQEDKFARKLPSMTKEKKA